MAGRLQTDASLEGFTPADRASLLIDGRQFSVTYLDEDYNPRDARLIVGPAAGCQGDDGNVLAN
ncbi:hypothetical protein [Singulisphaera sp. GP187]|uniref:hypothetical protein n=1 Tax=Singulisphaera sp. GP187 TaxID=1882752 RepID=UPI000941A4B8|nr:hypothetical protein [Singulisphaera sp. GP187]